MLYDIRNLQVILKKVSFIFCGRFFKTIYFSTKSLARFKFPVTAISMK